MEQRLNDAPCGFLSITHEGVIAEVNHTLLKWIGFEQVDLLQQHLEILLSTPNKLIFSLLFLSGDKFRTASRGIVYSSQT
ncbi:PAS domain-containing protein [Lysinibacillus sp. MHQ-1]|nr:PAS domain-containing protein [Lysinibacillus sp. MHQ-1]